MVNFRGTGGEAASLGQCKNFVLDILHARKQINVKFFPHPEGNETLSCGLFKPSPDFITYGPE